LQAAGGVGVVSYGDIAQHAGVVPAQEAVAGVAVGGVAGEGHVLAGVVVEATGAILPGQVVDHHRPQSGLRFGVGVAAGLDAVAIPAFTTSVFVDQVVGDIAIVGAPGVDAVVGVSVDAVMFHPVPAARNDGDAVGAIAQGGHVEVGVVVDDVVAHEVFALGVGQGEVRVVFAPLPAVDLDPRVGVVVQFAALDDVVAAADADAGVAHVADLEPADVNVFGAGVDADAVVVLVGLLLVVPGVPVPALEHRPFAGVAFDDDGFFRTALQGAGVQAGSPDGVDPAAEEEHAAGLELGEGGAQVAGRFPAAGFAAAVRGGEEGAPLERGGGHRARAGARGLGAVPAGFFGAHSTTCEKKDQDSERHPADELH